MGLWSYDGGTGRFTVDSTCRELFELGPDEPLNPDRMRQRIHPDDLPRYWAAIQEAMANDGDFQVQYRIVRKDGSVRFFSGRGRVRPHLPGEPVIINGVCIDVSDRRHLEEKLHATELQMKTLADSFPGLFCYIDSTYIVRFLSNRYLEHLGAPRADLVGRHLSELTGAERFQARKEVYAGSRDGDICFAVEDDGAGIPVQFYKKVFQTFHTLKPREETEGSGMGLAIVKRIVEWQGGRVWFRPGREGRGTVFKFNWKRSADAADKPASKPTSPNAKPKQRHCAG